MKKWKRKVCENYLLPEDRSFDHCRTIDLTRADCSNVTNRAVFVRKDANVSCPEDPYCARSVWKEGQNFRWHSSPRNRPTYLGWKTGCGADSFQRNLKAVGLKGGGRPAPTSAILMPSFLLNVSLVISIAVSLTCHRSVSAAVAPEKSKAAEFSPLKVR